jgi:hypothetical protein
MAGDAPVVDPDMITTAAVELGLAAARPGRSWTARMFMAVLLAGLVLVGAAAAAWVFSDSFARAVHRYGISLSK